MAFYDRIKTNAATINGTGNATWTAAATSFQLPPASIDQTVIYTIVDSAGTKWETGRANLAESGGTYTLTRGGSQTVTDSSNSGAAESFTNSSAHTLFLTPDALQFNRDIRAESATTVTTGDVSAAVNTHYALTISGMTADRNLVLPSGASAGDVISWELVTDAPAAYELILKGDTGVTVTLRDTSITADEVTRYFIEGETGKAVYDGSEWRINKANDGRIPFCALFSLTTDCDGETASTFVRPTSFSGVWTMSLNIGACGDSSTGTCVMRRDGNILASFSAANKDSLGAGQKFSARVFQVGGINISHVYEFDASTTARISGAGSASLSAGDTVEFTYYTEDGAIGLSGTNNLTNFAVEEKL